MNEPPSGVQAALRRLIPAFHLTGHITFITDGNIDDLHNGLSGHLNLLSELQELV